MINLPLCMEEDGTDVEDSFFSQYGGDGANVDDSFTPLYGRGWHLCGRFICLSVWRRMASMWMIHIPLCMEEDGTYVDNTFACLCGREWLQ